MKIENITIEKTASGYKVLTKYRAGHYIQDTGEKIAKDYDTALIMAFAITKLDKSGQDVNVIAIGENKHLVNFIEIDRLLVKKDGGVVGITRLGGVVEIHKNGCSDFGAPIIYEKNPDTGNVKPETCVYAVHQRI